MRPVQKRFGIRYTQVTSATRIEPVCTIESLNLHQHDDTCYDSEGNLTCGKKNDSFTYYVGSLAPGESKTLTYTVNVEPGAFMAAGNKDFRINNRACIYTDDSRTDGGVWLKGYNTSKTINRKVWSRKLAGGKQETESTVSMSGSVYDATGSSVTQITSPGSSFTVPAGSYKYQVAANEAGDWDLSSASMADSLGSQYMEFVGYVRVDAYTISSNAPGSGLDDAAAIANLSGRTPDQTVWVKVDGQTSFSFTPEQIGLGGTQAYLLTYYAQPTNIDGITQVVVSNRFELTGEVVIGNFRYVVLTGIGAEASVVVKGGNSFAAEKQSWYYEEPQVTTISCKAAPTAPTGWTTTRPARPCTAAKISLRNWAVSLPIPVPATPARTSSAAQIRPSAQAR